MATYRLRAEKSYFFCGIRVHADTDTLQQKIPLCRRGEDGVDNFTIYGYLEIEKGRVAGDTVILIRSLVK